MAKKTLTPEEQAEKLKKESDRNLKRFRKWMNANAVVRAIQGYLPNFIDGDTRKLSLNLNDSLQPCTDGKTIFISLLPQMLRDRYSEKDWSILLMGITAHEAQHVNSSNFSDIQYLRNWYGQYLKNNFELDESIGQKIAQEALNIVEDGRIEAIASSRRPGIIVPLRHMNNIIRENCRIQKKAEKPEEEYRDFWAQVLSYAKTGEHAPGAEEYANTDMELHFYAVRELIDDGINARTSAECRDCVQAMLEDLSTYLSKLLKSSEQLQQQMIQKDMTDEYTSDMESQYNDNQSGSGSPVRSKAASSSKRSGSKQSSGNQNSKDAAEKDGTDQAASAKNASSEKEEEEKEEQAAGKGDGSDPADEGNEEEEQETASDSPSSSDKEQGETQKEQTKESSDQKEPAQKGDDTKETPMGFSDTNNEVKPLTDQELAQVGEMLSRGIHAANQAQAKEEQSTVCGLDKKSIEEVRASYGAPTYPYIERKLNVPNTRELPPDMKLQALELRREFMRILQSRRSDQRGLRRGALDVNALWKVGVGDQAVFQRKGDPKAGSCSFYLLIDNSGSMSERVYSDRGQTLYKSDAARGAAGVIEEAISGIFPCKIALFNQMNSGCITDVLRDFQETQKGSRAWNSLLVSGPGGCNADSIHINLAAKELARRSENKKVLIILSDGEPSAYASRLSAMTEVRDAVKNARKNGVIVISIMFGSLDFIKRSYPKYEEMYEKNIIACEPQNISSTLSRVFRGMIKG